MRAPCALSRLLAVAGVLLAAGCQLVAPLPSDVCASDRDCPISGQICLNGTCSSATHCAPRCGDRCGPDGCGGFCRACGEGQGCDDGRCVPACGPGVTCTNGPCNLATGVCGCSETSCGPGLFCNLEVGGQCSECRNADDCGGMACHLGRCASCARHEDCGAPGTAGPICSSGRCVACANDGDCTASGHGTRCLDHACVACAADPDCGPGRVCEGHGCVAGACANSAADPRCTAHGQVCATAEVPPRCVECVAGDTSCRNGKVCLGHACVPPPACGAGQPPCHEEWQRCVGGTCLRCGQESDCPGGPCVAGACTNLAGCSFDHDCPAGGSGRACVGQKCGCRSHGDCDPGEVCDPGTSRCVACTADNTSQCAATLPACANGACVECAGDGPCQSSMGSAATCDTSSHRCRCTPAVTRCPTGQCGSVDTGCGAPLDCAANCAMGFVCNGGSCVHQPPTVGTGCTADTDCVASGLKCMKALFPGSDRVSAMPGACVRGNAAPCAAGETSLASLCIPTCASDADCAATMFCGTNRADGATKLCMPGCRMTGAPACPSPQSCDPYTHACLAPVDTSTLGGACTLGKGCLAGQTCLPTAAAPAGVCARSCTRTDTGPATFCLCVPGATIGGGGCQPTPGPAGITCAYDADCAVGLLCEHVSGKCAPSCDVATGNALAARACQTGTCLAAGNGWKESTLHVGTCTAPTTGAIGQACTSDASCGSAGAVCRWMAASGTRAGTCVYPFASPAACSAACVTADRKCIADPDGTGGAQYCTRSCVNPGDCGAALTCSASGCQPWCATGAQLCTSDATTTPATAYECRIGATADLRCQPKVATGGLSEGGTCTGDSDCQTGLTCAAPPYALTSAPLKCRSRCSSGQALCSNNTQTACLVPGGSQSGVCATVGAASDGASCGSSDDCVSGLVCVKGPNGAACRAACTVGSNQPGGGPPCAGVCQALDLNNLWNGGGCIPGGGQGGPPWCPAPTSGVAEVCNFCDEDGVGGADDGLRPTPDFYDLTSGLPAGRIIDSVAVPAGAKWGSGYVVFAIVEEAAALAYDLVAIRAINGVTSVTVLDVQPRLLQTLSPDHKLAVVGPLENVGADSAYFVAWKFFTGKSPTLRRFTRSGTGPDTFGFDQFRDDVKAQQGIGTDIRATYLPSVPLLVFGVRNEAYPDQVTLEAIRPATTDRASALVAEKAVLLSYAIAPHPNGSLQVVTALATASGVSFSTASFSTTGLPTPAGTTPLPETALSGTGTTTRLEAFTSLNQKRLLVVAERGGLQTLVVDDALTGRGGLTLVGAQPPWGLSGLDAPNGMGALLMNDGGQMTAGFVSMQTGEASWHRPFGPPAAAVLQLSMLHDGTRLAGVEVYSSNGTTRTELRLGCGL